MRAIFVYGTLKKGECNNYILESGFFIKEENLPQFSLVESIGVPFPFAIMDDEPKGIKGELYAVDDSVLLRLDQLEGHPSMYVRTEIGNVIFQGNKIPLFIYLFDKRKLREYSIVENGVWKSILS